MLVKDSKGREVEISVYGSFPDDIQIDEAFYTDGPDDQAEVSEEEVAYIEETYQSEIYEAWLDRQIGRAEAYADRDR